MYKYTQQTSKCMFWLSFPRKRESIQGVRFGIDFCLRRNDIKLAFPSILSLILSYILLNQQGCRINREREYADVLIQKESRRIWFNIVVKLFRRVIGYGLLPFKEGVFSASDALFIVDCINTLDNRKYTTKHARHCSKFSY